ncbi:MAG: FAD-dependent oxidoreductase [Porticoccaceae bacterium]|nr:FAD-dependent oxidoreductase [Porticoccaceae bacterium]
MKTSAKVVVVGGGVVGVSTLYHLAKKGWTDVVLVERKELTSGSTWHAAGLLPLFNMSYSVGKLHQYSVNFYHELEKETGQPVGFSVVSNIRLASNEDRMDEYRYYSSVAETVGVAVNFLTPEQVAQAWPMANIEGLIGAIQHPDDGYIQSADLTQALAKGARARGATIYRNTAMLDLEQQTDDSWVVKTDKGDIHCQHVVCCTGNFARKTGAMVGLDIPVIPVEHQYIVTEPHPEVLRRKAQGLPEQAVLRDSDAGYYLREENGGFILGPYEEGAPCCYVDGPSDQSEYELFNGDLDRLMPHIEACMTRVPAFAEVGVKTVYNGAIAYTPDGNPIVGPAWGRKNLWLNEGHSFGITAAGGAAWQLAEWIVDGEPTVDMMGVDPRRFGPYASRGYLRAKNEEAYNHVFKNHYPDEERSAGRPLKTSPCYDRMKALGAVFGSVYGWERPNWFAPTDYALSESELDKGDTLWNKNHSTALADGRIVEKNSFRRSNYFPFVGRECCHVHDKVGVLDMSAFSKCTVTGHGAEAWLNSIVANKVPVTIGRIGLCHMLSKNGGVRAEFTIYKRAKNSYYMVFAGAQERHDWDYLTKLAPHDGSVSLQKITTQMGVLVLAGPRSRDVLQKLTDTDLGNDNFKWLTGKSINVGYANAEALRVNFIGELGWELHHPIEMQNYIFDQLMSAGAEYDIKPFGIRAMESMRLEKSYRLIPREMSIEYSAIESGLDRFVKLDKDCDFVGKEALLAWRERGFTNCFATLEVHDVVDADARGSEGVYKDGALVGRATSGGFGFRINKSLALSLVQVQYGAIGTHLEIEILGKRYVATVIDESPFDGANQRLRS